VRDDTPDPLNYAAPEQQEPPRFAIEWGGWVLLAFVLVAAGSAAWHAIRGW
jgi:hypothetical protein